MRVFLGGTTAGKDYRDEVVPYLKGENISFFNPVVEDWTPADRENEEREKEICDTHLYVITKSMKGIYSIAEIMDSIYRGRPTIVFFDVDGLDEGQIRSVDATKKLINDIPYEGINAFVLKSLYELGDVLNWIEANPDLL